MVKHLKVSYDLKKTKNVLLENVTLHSHRDGEVSIIYTKI